MTRIRNCRRKRGGRIPQWSTPLLPFYISAILILPTSIQSQSLFRGVSFTELVEPYLAERTYDPNNPSETCFDKLYESDADGNGIVTNDEYNTFVAQLSEGDFNETNYIDLPFVIKVNFVYLSCLCRFLPENSDECCKGPDGGIYTSGTGPDEVPTDNEEAYLVTVCSETQGAIDYARNETTSSPTIVTSASPTVGPTLPPSAEPTKSPSNPPSTSPSQSPSPKPTSLAPTLSPSTAQPSASPTLEPSTNSPTPPPTTNMPTAPEPVTNMPTKQPTPQPVTVTKDPTSSGTVLPTPIQVPDSLEPTLSVPVPTVPVTKAPTQGPTTSSQPSNIEGAVIPPTTNPEEPITPPSPPSISDGGSPGGVEKPDDGDRGTEETESISAGGIAGIVIASAFVAYAAAYVYATKKRRRRDEDDPDLQEVRNKDFDDLEAGEMPSVEERKSGGDEPNQDKKDCGSDESKSGGSGKVSSLSGDGDSPGDKSSGSTPPVFETESYDASDYIPQSSDAGLRSPPASSDILVSGVPPSPKRSKVAGSKESNSYDDSSSAGESGWSSSAGLSSLNTASFDAATEDGLLPASPDRLMATIGAAEAITATAGSTQRDAKPTFIPTDNSLGSSDISYDENTPAHAALAIHGSDHPTSPPAQNRVTREDLNAAIEAGDWAVVGATAALLADTDHSSESELRGGPPSTKTSESFQTESSESNHRAAELDRMVESGDWEGVVLAAAQFEGSSSIQGEDEDTQFSSNVSTSENGSPSAEEKEEIRAEVERLVRRVVPDEIDNIDEMMIQFEGREAELVETLRTMQERNVAQRARAAVQKTAKLEARANAAMTTSPGSVSSSSEPSYYAGSAGDSSVSDYAPSSSSTYENDSSSITDSSVSELGMNTNSEDTSSRKTTQSSLELAIEKGDWRAVGEAAAMMGSGEEASEVIIPDDFEGSSSFTSVEESSSSKAKRVNYLDNLIAKGDWAGIVAAAGTYQAIDDSLGGGTPQNEEEEALAQAKMWEDIAKQSKPGAPSSGAGDAADWALDRAMKTPPKKSSVKDDESV